MSFGVLPFFLRACSPTLPLPQEREAEELPKKEVVKFGDVIDAPLPDRHLLKLASKSRARAEARCMLTLLGSTLFSFGLRS